VLLWLLFTPLLLYYRLERSKTTSHHDSLKDDVLGVVIQEQTSSMQPPPQQSSSRATIVTAYFQIRSKYQKEVYLEWMSIMLSLRDNMVIYCTSDWKDSILQLRPKDAQTHFVIMNITELPLARDYDATFWQEQLNKDPEKKRHAGYEVFWIWLSKPWFVVNAIHLNPFDSDIYMWSDIGCFRGGAAKRYQDQMLIQHPEVVPQNRVLFLSHKPEPQPPASLWWNNKLHEKDHFYHSGSQMVAYKQVWLQFQEAFRETMQGFLERNLFIGDDQPVFQCTCTQHSALCAYVTRNQVKDNHYFGLRYVLFHGGTYQFWYPPLSS
jgi:hypothetical protein